jgi:uncharacterized membrane protein
MGAISQPTRRSAATERQDNLKGFIAAGLLLGIGLGGFVDGIVFHQILQWHHMLTSEGSYPATTIAGLKANTLADGLFHLATWIATAAGAWLLYRSSRRTPMPAGRYLIGLALAGWGSFNLVEGTIDHHILDIHHVKSGEGAAVADLGFLVFGAALLIGGLWMARRAEPSGRTAREG